ncbi:endonuclease domain-containing protein [Candidatus Pacearchaeota archaeon]|nr:endonuclease domain-containing protein [Candidatus Pacearchaeota archaeon]
MVNQYKIRKFKCIGCGEITEQRRSIHHTKYCSLDCYRKSKRPNRKTGSLIKCQYCGKKIYKRRCCLKNSKNYFCGTKCANKYQGRNKIVFICKICKKKFRWSKSRTIQSNPLYCSWKCRLKDTEHIQKNSIKGNLAQQKKKGLNKLELKGRKILNELGVQFKEQVLMFNKFLVDVLLINKNIIIQWDGEYWHNKPKRKMLDKSQDLYLLKCGYKVIRITDKHIKDDIGGVYANIKRAIQ